MDIVDYLLDAYRRGSNLIAPNDEDVKLRQQMLPGMLSMTPVIGDAMSGYDVAQSARQGNYGDAALNAVGLLPFVPGMAGVMKKIPKSPGSSNVPDGYVRLYHQTTPEAIESIEKEGIRFSKAKGIDGPKGIYADEKGFYGKPGEIPTVEIMVKKEDWNAPFVMKDVAPNEIIGSHLPWHGTVRALLDPDNKAYLEAALSGRFDKRGGDMAKAVEYLKEMFKGK